MRQVYQSAVLLLISQLGAALPGPTTAATADTPLAVRNDLSQFYVPIEAESPFISRDRHYIIAFIKVNWWKAHYVCNANGMALATVATLEHNLQLTNYVKGYSINHRLGPLEFWLGASDYAHQGIWFWLSNGLPLTFNDWAPGQPNNTASACLSLDENLQWSSRNCKNSYFFICENICPLDSFSVPIYV